MKQEEDLKHLLNWHLSLIIFKLIIICNFKVSLVALIIDSVHYTSSIQETSSSSQFEHSFNNLQKRSKRYNWILQCGQTPIVLVWLHDRNPHPEQKKGRLALGIKFLFFYCCFPYVRLCLSLSPALPSHLTPTHPEYQNHLCPPGQVTSLFKYFLPAA